MPNMVINLRGNRLDSRIGTTFFDPSTNTYELCYKPKSKGKQPGFFTVEINDALVEFLYSLHSENPAEEAALNVYRGMVTQYSTADKKDTFYSFIDDYNTTKNCDNLIHFLTMLQLIQNHDALFKTYMYKMDHPKNLKTKGSALLAQNKETLKEYFLSRVARGFNKCNQEVKLVRAKDESTVQSKSKRQKDRLLLKCSAFPNLLTGDEYLLHPNVSPYRGMFVANPELKQSVYSPLKIKRLGLHFPLLIAFDDPDGVGKDGANIGIIPLDNGELEYAGIDAGNGLRDNSIIDWIEYKVVDSTTEDFNYSESTLAKYAPKALTKEDSKLGQVRHLMFRNYSVFNNCSYIEKLAGVQLLSIMLTGEIPAEEVIAQYDNLLPRFRDDIAHLTEQMNENLMSASDQEDYPTNLLSQIHQGIQSELTQMKDSGYYTKKDISAYQRYLQAIHKKVLSNISKLLSTFERRLQLPPLYAQMLDNMEKYLSPSTCYHQLGKDRVLLDELRFISPDLRAACHLKLSDDDCFCLTIKTSVSIETLAKIINQLPHPPLILTGTKNQQKITGTLEQLEVIAANMSQLVKDKRIEIIDSAAEVNVKDCKNEINLH